MVTSAPEQPAPPQRPAPALSELINQLRADLLAERARYLRLESYIEEVLAAGVPEEDEPVPGWEAPGDYRAYWAQLAAASLRDDDAWRGLRPRGAVPVLGPPAQDAPPGQAA